MSFVSTKLLFSRLSDKLAAGFGKRLLDVKNLLSGKTLAEADKVYQSIADDLAKLKETKALYKSNLDALRTQMNQTNDSLYRLRQPKMPSKKALLEYEQAKSAADHLERLKAERRQVLMSADSGLGLLENHTRFYDFADQHINERVLGRDAQMTLEDVYRKYAADVLGTPLDATKRVPKAQLASMFENIPNGPDWVKFQKQFPDVYHIAKGSGGVRLDYLLKFGITPTTKLTVPELEHIFFALQPEATYQGLDRINREAQLYKRHLINSRKVEKGYAAYVRDKQLFDTYLSDKQQLTDTLKKLKAESSVIKKNQDALQKDIGNTQLDLVAQKKERDAVSAATGRARIGAGLGIAGISALGAGGYRALYPRQDSMFQDGEVNE